MVNELEEASEYFIRPLGRGGVKVCDQWCDVTPGYPPEIDLHGLILTSSFKKCTRRGIQTKHRSIFTVTDRVTLSMTLD